MTIATIGQLLSLAITPICLISVIWVVKLYLKTAIDNGIPCEPSTWLVLGIVISFAASKTVDHYYWFIHWSCFFLEKESTVVLTKYGPTVNLIFRQLMGILVATCHIRAAYLYYTSTGQDAASKLKSDLILVFLISMFLFSLGLLVVYLLP